MCQWTLAVQGYFMSCFHWRLNLRLQNLQVTNVAIWIQIWGLPLEYHNLEFVQYIGAMIGTVEWID